MGNIFHEKRGEKKGIGTERRLALFERGWVTKKEKSPQIRDLLIIMSIIFLKNAIKHHYNRYQTYWNPVLHPFSTNLLTRVHWTRIQYYLGLSLKIVTLHLQLYFCYLLFFFKCYVIFRNLVLGLVCPWFYVHLMRFKSN